MYDMHAAGGAQASTAPAASASALPEQRSAAGDRFASALRASSGSTSAVSVSVTQAPSSAHVKPARPIPAVAKKLYNSLLCTSV